MSDARPTIAVASPFAALDLVSFLHQQRAFSARVFGPGRAPATITNRLGLGFSATEAAQCGLEDWIGLAWLALDGAWRAGFSPEEIAAALAAAQRRAEMRFWPGRGAVDLMAERVAIDLATSVPT